MQMHIVNSGNRHCHADLLDAFFRVRHNIYVEEKNWRGADPGGREKDQFDTDAATYLIGTIDGEVASGSRLIPTIAPHMVSDVFGHMVGRSLIRQPDVAEWTRGFIVRKYRERGLGYLKAQICAAVMDYCLQEGVVAVGGVQDMYWMPLWRRLGWTVRMVGEPAPIDGRNCVVAFFDVTEDARNRARHCGKLASSNLHHQGPYRPFAANAEALSNAA